MERQLEDKLRCRRDSELAAGEGWEHVQVRFEALQNFVRIQLEVAHHLGEGVPFDLRKTEKNVFIGQQGMIAAS